MDFKERDSRNEKADDGANVEHVDQQTEPIALLHLGREEIIPRLHQLRRVDQRAADK
jgi:hypothetical protein